MSSILESGNNKSKCQKFTPTSLVETMLDIADYKNNLMGKTVLENSFGTGNILKAIVKRYIEDALTYTKDKELISFNLSNDIYGIELDKQLYESCLNELNDIVANYNLPKVAWKLFNQDALTFQHNISFDYVIGNPPYISYKEIDKENRAILKEKYSSCSIGKFDYCYAFIESGIRLLTDSGKMIQLIPNNIYKNVFGDKLREMLKDHISIIYDYPNQKLFKDTLTSISIFVYDKNANGKIKYRNITEKTKKNIDRNSLAQKWIFDTNLNGNSDYLRFGDIFNASIAIATLFNKAFIVDSNSIEAKNIESTLLRSAVSPKTLRYGKKKKIIFPYRYIKGKLKHYTKDDFEELFPNGVTHLKKFHKELMDRKSDKNALWFEYGRSQALAHLYKEKLLLSTIVTNRAEIYKLDKTTIPFSGIYITVKNENYTLDDAIEILQSDAFIEYVKKIGINVSGQSMRITCKDINNYMFLRRI